MKLASPGARREWKPEQIRDALVVLLTLVTGATDAIGFARLGGVFTSVMTGNIVLLGVAAGRQSGSLALHAGLAVAGYVAGSWLGAQLAGRPAAGQPVWPRPITVAVGVELAFFAVFGVWWEVAGGRPAGLATYALIAINAVALGIQSSAVLRFGVPGLSSTYLTGTLTELAASFSRRRALLLSRSTTVLLALLGGAGLGAVLAIEVPRAVPALPLGVLAVVLLAAIWVFGRSSTQPATNEGPSQG